MDIEHQSVYSFDLFLFISMGSESTKEVGRDNAGEMATQGKIKEVKGRRKRGEAAEKR